jgi:hypothetical protein
MHTIFRPEVKAMTQYKLSHITDLSQLSNEAVAAFAKDLPTLVAALRLAKQAAEQEATGIPLAEVFPFVTLDSEMGDKLILRKDGQDISEFEGVHVRTAGAANVPVNTAPLTKNSPILQNAREAFDWHDKLFDELLVSMGSAAPKPGTLPHTQLCIRLARAIEATRADRIEFFQCEYKSPDSRATYSEQWFKDAVIKNGVRALSDETDENLLSRVINCVPWPTLKEWLFFGESLTPFGEEFLAIMLTTLASSIVDRHYRSGLAVKTAAFIEGASQALDAMALPNPFRFSDTDDAAPGIKPNFH